MSSKFTIEMPKPGITKERISLFASSLLFMAGPMIAIPIAITDRTMHPVIAIVLIVSSVFGLFCGALVLRRDLNRIQNKQAEKFLKSAIKRLGYVALEPIEVTGTKDRVLLRDHHCSALWDVAVQHNKVVCVKRR